MKDQLHSFVFIVAILFALLVITLYLVPDYFPLIAFGVFSFFFCLGFIFFSELIHVDFLFSILRFLILMIVTSLVVYFFLHFRIDILAELMKGPK